MPSHRRKDSNDEPRTPTSLTGGTPEHPARPEVAGNSAQYRRSKGAHTAETRDRTGPQVADVPGQPDRVRRQGETLGRT